MRSGFPHSDIRGSKLVCELPAAFRTLQRPSSPVIAKASTTCTYSLDPITLSSALRQIRHRQLALVPPSRRLVSHRMRVDTITTHALIPFRINTLYFFQIFKELNSLPTTVSRQSPTLTGNWQITTDGGGERDRTDDLLLAKQALSQLSYTPRFTPVVGLDGFEPSTPALSRRCSNQLSYRPPLRTA